MSSERALDGGLVEQIFGYCCTQTRDALALSNACPLTEGNLRGPPTPRSALATKKTEFQRLLRFSTCVAGYLLGSFVDSGIIRISFGDSKLSDFNISILNA